VDNGLAAYKAGDYAKALSELQPAAAQGSASAEKALAKMYAIGQGVKEDGTQAIAWWTKAAEAGDAEAQWELGWSTPLGSALSATIGKRRVVPESGGSRLWRCANELGQYAVWRLSTCFGGSCPSAWCMSRESWLG